MAREEARQSGDFFKPHQHKNDHAILIRTKRVAPQSPGYLGELKDAVYADVTTFATEADLSGDGAPKEYKNARIDHSLLQKHLARFFAEGTDELVRTLGKWQGEKMKQPAWSWNFGTEEIRTQVWEWVDQKNTELEEALAGGAASFLDD